MPDIVQAASTLCCAIERVLALARAPIDGLRVVIDQMGPGVRRGYAETLRETVLITSLQRVVNGVTAGIDHANAVVLRIRPPGLIERQQARPRTIVVIQAGVQMRRLAPDPAYVQDVTS